MKKPIKNQLSLFAALESPVGASDFSAAPGLTGKSDSSPHASPLAPRGVSLDYRAALVEQTIRDFKVLQEEEWCHVPNTEFFANRIVAYRQTIAELDASCQLPSKESTV